MSHANSLTAFICYRRVDGSAYAAWVADALFEAKATDKNGQAATVLPYYDQETPGVSDWKKHHFPSLETAEVLIVIVTPGIAIDLSGRSSKDWVYEEIAWWIKHRASCPIVIDCTTEGTRWIPKPIKDNWPSLNWLSLSNFDITEPGDDSCILVRRILKTIEIGSRRTLFEDLQRQQKLSRRLRIALWTSGTFLVFAIASAAYALFALSDRQEALREAQIASQTAFSQNVELQKSVIKLLFLCPDNEVDETAKLFSKFIDGTTTTATLYQLADTIIQNQEKSAAVVASINLLCKYKDYGQSAALDEVFTRMLLTMGQHDDPKVKLAVMHFAEILSADRHGHTRPDEPNN